MSIAEGLKQSVEAGDVPGVAAVAANAEGTIFEGAAGTLQPDSVIWIASMTKAITGAAAMQMVEQGKFGLDTPAADIVPEIARKEVLVTECLPEALDDYLLLSDEFVHENSAGGLSGFHHDGNPLLRHPGLPLGS